MSRPLGPTGIHTGAAGYLAQTGLPEPIEAKPMRPPSAALFQAPTLHGSLGWDRHCSFVGSPVRTNLRAASGTVVGAAHSLRYARFLGHGHWVSASCWRSHQPKSRSNSSLEGLDPYS
jgi:hypothetical protein